ncbi:GFA family protein [Caldimonas sp. KR1-144]|uniref:GFA family protein n=1 Tax=Caldimonas sp. KR1-144 TaxID=3400911 RepID=UPI003BFF4E68
MTAVYEGGCQCGAVRWRGRGPVANLCFCHCESCRRASGAPFVAWGTFALEGFAIVRGALAQQSSSAHVRRGFCGACGTSLTYFHEGRAEEIDVTLASLDDPARLVPQRHIWVADKLPWVTLADGLPQYETVRSSAELP